MASGTIPFLPSDNNYRLAIPIDTVMYLFDTHWNSKDQSWYFDLREQDESPIALGVRVVLGASLGRSSHHPFFTKYMLHAIDTTGEGREAGFDDLGARVVVRLSSIADLGF